MATTVYFEETIRDQGGKAEMDVEIGNSTYYRKSSIYLRVGEQLVIMDRETAKRFVDAVVAVGRYNGFVD